MNLTSVMVHYILLMMITRYTNMINKVPDNLQFWSFRYFIIEDHRTYAFKSYWSIVLYCIVLYCIVLYCIVLYCIVLYCIVLY